MVYQICNIIFMTLTGFVQGSALEYMLEVNNERTNRVFRYIYWAILALIPAVINVLGPDVEQTLVLRNVISITMGIIAIKIFYTDVMWRRILALIIVYMGVTSSEIVLLGIAAVAKIDIVVFTQKDLPLNAVLTAIGMSIGILNTIIFAMIWRKFKFHVKILGYFNFFMVYFINHLIMFAVIENQILNFLDQYRASVPIITSFICDIAMIIIAFSQMEKESMEEKLEKEKKLAILEKIHYEEVQKRRERLFAITNDSNAEIRQIRECLRNNEDKHAEKLLQEFLKKIENTKEYPYCEIPVINVILSEKKKQCDEVGIQFVTDLKMPDILEYKYVDMCSICGNLMDNAIRAGLKLREAGEEARIELISGMKGDYLIIKCKNQCLEVKRDNMEGTGYGLKILKEIAEKYQGHFHTEFDNQMFLAQITLKV